MSSASGTSHYSPGRARGHGQEDDVSATHETRDKEVETRGEPEARRFSPPSELRGEFPWFPDYARHPLRNAGV